MNIAPGAKVAVEVVATPRNEAARKTLQRLLRKDPAVVRANRHVTRKRPSLQRWRRGGKMWHHQMKSKPGVELTPGRRYTLCATVDVIRDLASVRRWVKVVTQPARAQ